MIYHTTVTLDVEYTIDTFAIGRKIISCRPRITKVNDEAVFEAGQGQSAQNVILEALSNDDDAFNENIEHEKNMVKEGYVRDDEEYDCPIHGKLGGIDECPRC